MTKVTILTSDELVKIEEGLTTNHLTFEEIGILECTYKEEVEEHIREKFDDEISIIWAIGK